MIKIVNLTKTFKKHIVLNEVNLLFERGVYGLLGPNGAGKTTLMRSMLGLYKIQRGDILYNNISTKKNSTFTKDIGYLPQTFGLFKELSVYEMMQYLATLKGIEKTKQKPEIEKCIEQTNLSSRMYNKVRTLSGGMIRRLGIAQALLGDPQVIIVDEPTAGLDPEERARFKNLIMQIKENKTIIISTHIVEDVEAICNNIVIIDKGTIVGYGDNKYISYLALNKVFLVPAEKESSLIGDCFIVKREQIDGDNILRVITNTEQDGIPVSPTVEDGYISRIKGLG